MQVHPLWSEGGPPSSTVLPGTPVPCDMLEGTTVASASSTGGPHSSAAPAPMHGQLSSIDTKLSYGSSQSKYAGHAGTACYGVDKLASQGPGMSPLSSEMLGACTHARMFSGCPFLPFWL